MIVKVCPVCGTNYPDEAAFCARDRTPLGASATGLVGRLLAERYQIERKLGEGGMGEVYLARHILMGRASAIKVMSATLGRDPDAINRFNREATNASRIDHPNVCAVYDFGVTPEGQLFLAMEYLEGPTLTAALARGPLPLERAGALLTQCAAGLPAAHELGIVHRDLKPDNIMLLERRGRETAKRVDFGIAKAGSADGSQ
ncbi:MAG TPA: serine/threonine-protein kinase, partial [Actinotalea sp.]|nr:serine/threonine-protein kinase [Actinotalea sp.]